MKLVCILLYSLLEIVLCKVLYFLKSEFLGEDFVIYKLTFGFDLPFLI